jgi:hypothetical protein
VPEFTVVPGRANLEAMAAWLRAAWMVSFGGAASLVAAASVASCFVPSYTAAESSSGAGAGAGSASTASGGGSGSGGRADGGGGSGGEVPSCDGSTGDGVCAPAATPPFVGPFVYAATEGGPAPSCPNAWPTEVLRGQHDLVVPGGCTPCTCDPTVTCSATFEVFDGGDCLAQKVPDVTLVHNDCNPIQMGVSYRAQPPVPSGDCMPSTSVPVGSPSFTFESVLCEAPTGPGCDTGACTPPVPPGFRLCVTAESGACPDEYPEHMATLYKDFDDQRSCETCTCGALDANCSGFSHVALFKSAGCILDQQHVNADGVCVAASGNLVTQARLNAPVTSASCPAGGGGLEGQAVPVDLLGEVCCR